MSHGLCPQPASNPYKVVVPEATGGADNGTASQGAEAATSGDSAVVQADKAVEALAEPAAAHVKGSASGQADAKTKAADEELANLLSKTHIVGDK